jgi:sporulation protein YunB
MMLVIAKKEVKRIAQDAMLDGVRSAEQRLKGNMDKVMSVEKDASGRISYVHFDPQVQAQVYDRLTTSIQDKLKNLHAHDVGITIGQMLGSNIFSEYGPNIPIQVWPEGSTKVSIEPKLEAAGINMVLITLNVHVQTEMGLVAPFTETSFPVEYDYPVTSGFVVGEVPDYYFYNDLGQVKKEQVRVPVPPPAEPVVPQIRKTH